MSCYLYLDDSTVIEQTVTDEDGLPVNTAAVTVTIYDSDGAEISDEAWPVTLDYVAASDGVYRKTFDPFTSLVAGSMYLVKTSIVDGSVQTACNQDMKAAVKYC